MEALEEELEMKSTLFPKLVGSCSQAGSQETSELIGRWIPGCEALCLSCFLMNAGFRRSATRLWALVGTLSEGSQVSMSQVPDTLA